MGTCAVCCGPSGCVGHACAAPTSTTSDAVWGRVDSSGVRAPTTLQRPGTFPRASDGTRGRIATATATACIAGRHGGRMGEELVIDAGGVIDAVHPTTSLHNGPPGGVRLPAWWTGRISSLTMLDGVDNEEYVVHLCDGKPWLPSVGVRRPGGHPVLFFQLPIFLVLFRVGPPPPSVCACALQKPSG